MREDLRPAYLRPIAPDGKYTSDEAPRADSFFLLLPRQAIYTDQMRALEKKTPRYAYEKGGVPLIKVYSGSTVAPTLNADGRPEVKMLGLVNSLVAGGLVLAVVGALMVVRRRGMGAG
jgi:hypothetical protein